MEKIKKALTDAAKKVAGEIPQFRILRNTDLNHADISTDLCFRLSRIVRKKPEDTARLIIEEINRDKPDEVAEIKEIKGYLNIFYSDTYLRSCFNEIISRDKGYGSAASRDEKVNLEFCSANPTGPLHIAHGRQAVVGDVLANILQKAGYEVTREYYVNDSGNQIELLAQSLYLRYKELFGEAIQLGENHYIGEYIIELAKELKNEVGDRYLNDPDFTLLKEYAINNMIEKIKNTLKSLGISFDTYTSQKQLENLKADEFVVKMLTGKGLTFDEDGAVWVKSRKYGDDQDRVIVKSDGTYPYRVPDYAYHIDKCKRGFDFIVDILGPDHHSHSKDLSSFLKMLGKSEELFKVVIIQHCRVISKGEELKMSKRKGTFITLDELLEQVPRDVVRYFFCMRKPQTHLDFDLDLAVNTSLENPVYYIQYAHTRISSIFRKAEEGSMLPNSFEIDMGLLNPPEKDLLRLLIRFPSYISLSARELDPTFVVNYATEVARSFQSYYQKADRDRSLVVLSNNKNLRENRLSLLKAIGIVLKNCFDIIGVSAPEKM